MGQRAGRSADHLENAQPIGHLAQRQQNQLAQVVRQMQQTASTPPNMQELYLRKNCIADLREIRYLLDLPQLKSLWLYDNPCAQQ